MELAAIPASSTVTGPPSPMICACNSRPPMSIIRPGGGNFTSPFLQASVGRPLQAPALSRYYSGLNDYLLSTILGVIEGLTEFLPVSSTAHLRIAEALLGVDLGNGYWKMFSIVIQF